MTILGINTIAAQCPDYVATNAAETCVGVAWLGSDVPEPLPPGFTIVEAPYIYLTGGGTSIADLALYTLNGEITNPLDCGLSINLFTGTLFFQDYSCTYVNGVLPVTLTSFEVHQKHNSVVVEWSTSYEYQNKEFNVQRSKDGLNWEIIGTVVGAGSTDANMEYRFVDEFSS